MISQDKSEWEETLFYYRALGFSEDEAFLAAMKEQGRKMLKDGAAGAITGTITAGGRLAGSKIQDGIQNYRNYKGAVQNGRIYHDLNNMTKGELARSLGNMNVEQSYRSMSPEAILKNSGLSPTEARFLLESNGYSVEKTSELGEISNRERIEKIAGNDIINNKHLARGIDAEIDKFTPCLIERNTGKILDTIYNRATSNDIRDLKKRGWLFNWNAANLRGADIYKLALDGDVDPQGLIAISDDPDNYAIYVNLVESAPQNKGKGGNFEGVGGHLFAIAAKLSVDKGYGGYLFLDAKNMELVSHYENTLGAQLIGGAHPYRMVIDESAAKRIIEKYTLREE